MKRWTFDNDELFDLVACGKKRGTCSLYGGDDQLSKIGDINIIYNSKNEQIKIQLHIFLQFYFRFHLQIRNTR